MISIPAKSHLAEATKDRADLDNMVSHVRIPITDRSDSDTTVSHVTVGSLPV